MFRTEDDEEENEEPPKTFEQMFHIFATLAEPDSDGTHICLTASNRWMKQAKILDGKRLRETDTGVAFFKFKRRAISFDNYLLFLQDVCDKKGLNFDEIKDMMTTCQDPTKMDEKLPLGAGKPKPAAAAADADKAKPGAAAGVHRGTIIAQLKAQGVGLSKQEKEEMNQ